MSIELYTEDRLVYQFYPVTSNQVTFRVKAPNDAHIILTSTPYESQPCYEIFFGGWGNTKSVIRKNKTQPDVVEVHTPQLLQANNHKAFWIKWEYGTISAGVQGDLNPILRHQDPQLFPIQYFGVSTGWGATGHWLIDAAPVPQPSGFPTPSYVPTAGGVPPPAAMAYPQPGFNPPFNPGFVTPTAQPAGFGAPTMAPRWLPSAGGSVPPNAVVAGNDANGETIYLARAHHEGALIPGKMVPSHRVAYVPWGGRENHKDQYEILCDCSPRWVPAIGGSIPPGAFVCGNADNGESLYAGRAHHNGSLTPGKVQPSHGVCYIPFGGEELAKPEYEILVI